MKTITITYRYDSWYNMAPCLAEACGLRGCGANYIEAEERLLATIKAKGKAYLPPPPPKTITIEE